mgnify:CR=1 FL=1
MAGITGVTLEIRQSAWVNGFFSMYGGGSERDGMAVYKTPMGVAVDVV